MSSPTYSRRTLWNTQPGALALAWNDRQLSGRECFDLTISNPTAAGFSYDMSAIAEALASGASAAYSPVPFGLVSAREAVAAYYRSSHHLDIRIDRILLTVSTSEAYSYLFRLLCDPGDEVLYCQPGYPLFDYLADLDNVALRPVSWLHDADGWHLDRGGLESSLSQRTRAVLLVHPNNPSGHFTSQSDREWLDRWCAGHQLALIVDEVFLDYGISAPEPSFLATDSSAATFVLSGISKISGLPQMKVAWIALHGPEVAIQQAAERLEVIADTFLSVSTPMHLALPALLEARKTIQPQILDRLRSNLAFLDAQLTRQSLVSRTEIQGGWYACLTVPAHEDSEAGAVRLLLQTGAYVHPGVFFGFDGEGVWVVSLLTPPETFEPGILALLAHAQNLT